MGPTTSIASKFPITRTNTETQEMDEEEREQEDDRRRRDEREKNDPFVIKIPSYQQVLESSHSQTSQPSLFTASPSFSQAFNFIKSSEFYTPPPPPPPLEVSSTTPPTASAAAAASRFSL